MYNQRRIPEMVMEMVQLTPRMPCAIRAFLRKVVKIRDGSRCSTGAETRRPPEGHS